MSPFTSLKDRLIAKAAKMWFNQKYKHYGKMTNIQIDSIARSIHVELDLKGESSPIQINVKSYELLGKSSETQIALGEIETSREWVNLLIHDYLPPEKKIFTVPGVVKAIL